MIIDEIITFITSSKTITLALWYLLQLWTDLWSILTFTNIIWILKSFQVVSCIDPLFNFLRRKIHMSYFESMSRLSVVFHMNICITTHIVVNLLNSIEKTYFRISWAISAIKLSSMFISMKVKIHSNDPVSLGGFYQVLNLILTDGFHIVFMVSKPYNGVSARHGFL